MTKKTKTEVVLTAMRRKKEISWKEIRAMGVRSPAALMFGLRKRGLAALKSRGIYVPATPKATH